MFIFSTTFAPIDIYFHLTSLTQLLWIRTVIFIFLIQEFINHVGHSVVDSLQSSFPLVICVVSSLCLLHVLQNLFRLLYMYLFYSLCLVKCFKVIGSFLLHFFFDWLLQSLIFNEPFFQKIMHNEAKL